MIHTIFFDLDNTIYSRKSGIWEAIGMRINRFMTDILHISEQEALSLRKKFRTDYGTTLLGLQSMYEVDEMEYLEYVHDIDLHAMLTDDGQLGKMLSTISQRKIIFTNSDQAHANRVLQFFHIKDYFDLIIDVIAMKPYVKPHPQAYQIALDLAGYASADGCMFIDDMLENVQQAAQLGFFSVYIGDDNSHINALEHIFELPKILEPYTNKKL